MAAAQQLQRQLAMNPFKAAWLVICVEFKGKQTIEVGETEPEVLRPVSVQKCPCSVEMIESCTEATVGSAISHFQPSPGLRLQSVHLTDSPVSLQCRRERSALARSKVY